MSSYRIILGGGVAIAALLLPTKAQAEPLVQPVPAVSNIQRAADPLGGPVTPSNPTQFHAQPAAQGSQVLPQSPAASEVNGPQNRATPLQWQSELLDNQRRSRSGFPVFNLDID